MWRQVVADSVYIGTSPVTLKRPCVLLITGQGVELDTYCVLLRHFPIAPENLLSA